jgi:hypothetical protein
MRLTCGKPVSVIEKIDKSRIWVKESCEELIEVAKQQV